MGHRPHSTRAHKIFQFSASSSPDFLCFFESMTFRFVAIYKHRYRESTHKQYSRKMQNNKESGDKETYQVRKLEITDKCKGFMELLQQLTVCDSVSDEEFQNRFEELKSYGDDHVICVIEDATSSKIVATGSVFIEKKFIRGCGKVGHIEDIVVDSSARGLQLGKKVVGFLADHARSTGCYKVILDCSADNKAFYEKCGFKEKEIQMVKYFV